MPELAVCIGCGKNVETAMAYIREDGLRCPACNARAEIAADQASLEGREAEDLERSLSRRARRLAKAHTIMWLVLIIILAKGQDGWYTPLLILPAVLLFRAAAAQAVGLSRRAGPRLERPPGRGGPGAFGVMQTVVAAFAGLCAAFLLVLVWVLREAFRNHLSSNRTRGAQFGEPLVSQPATLQVCLAAASA
jgi:hypothetical protein